MSEAPFKFFRPQKARPPKDGELEKLYGPDWIIELKENGHRMYVCQEGAYSATGIWYPKGLNSGCELLCPRVPDDAVFDIELRAREGISDSPTVTSLRSSAPGELVGVVLDVLKKPSTAYATEQWMTNFRKSERIKIRDQVLALCDPYWFRPVSTLEGDIQELLTMVVEQGYEGLVLHRPDARWVPGSRANAIKLKGTETYDVVIVDCSAKPTEWRVKPGEVGKDGVHYPQGRHSEPWLKGYVGLTYGFYDAKTGELRKVGDLGYTGPKEVLKQYVGHVAEVKSFGKQWPSGALNHPQFLRWRTPDDKLDTDCVFDFPE